MRKIIKLIKIGSVDKPYRQSDFGNSVPHHLGLFQNKPAIGDRFWLEGISSENGERGISTSPVVKIVDDNTFETMNSIYKWQIISELLD